MSVVERPMYWARCDYPECTATTSDYETGNGIVYATPEALDAEFVSRWEGGLVDDWGWLRIGDKHYCGDHVEWDEESDERVPQSHDSQTPGPPRMNGSTAIASGNVPGPKPAPTTEETP